MAARPDLTKKASLGRKALVIGASMAGLMAARVLSDYFQEVALVERDTLPQENIGRSGVPQGRHIHVLMLRGQQSMERFFSGFARQLDETGVPYVHWMRDVSLYLSTGWLMRDDLNLVTRTTTRPNLEGIVREELAKLPNVSFIDGCQVNNLIADRSGNRVIGLDVSYRRGAGEQVGKSETLLADLVLDASGRSTRLPEWLQPIGYQAPAQTQVDSKLGYASRLYSRLSYEPDWKIIGINTKAPDQPRGGTINLQEGGKWIVSLLGYGRENQPPTDPEAFLAFAKSLSRPDIYQALKGAEPISDISGFANITNTWNHYERMERFPAGLVVLGDAVCCFNPIYAQGMTTVALAAETLDQCLSQIPSIDALGMTFQKRMAKVIANPWLLATGTDFQFPETEGKRPGGMTGLAQGYLERLLGMIHHDTQVATAFVEVMNMLKPPTALFHPSLVVKVLSHSMPGKPEKAPALPVHG